MKTKIEPEIRIQTNIFGEIYCKKKVMREKA